MLEAMAIPMIRHWANGCAGGSERNTGLTMLKSKTGAATLLIHMLAKEATSIYARSKMDGLLEGAIDSGILCFPNSALVEDLLPGVEDPDPEPDPESDAKPIGVSMFQIQSSI